MVNALWITLIGMGLVFIAILLLWAGMALLVRLTAERAPQAEVEDQHQPIMAAADSGLDEQTSRKRRAAAAAVAVAMALCQKPVLQPEKRINGASAWQAAHRATELGRKPR